MANKMNDGDNEQNHLLAQLDKANRLLEMDKRSIHFLSSTSLSGHSRASSTCSLGSIASSNSLLSNHVTKGDNDASFSAVTLWETWGHIVNDWDNVRKKGDFLHKLVRMGIPQEFRGLAWVLMAGCHGSNLKRLYQVYMKKSSQCEKLIRRDITRTFPDHKMFKDKAGGGQETLFNVMKAYSLHDLEVGYCQGSGFIVGLLLMHMPEEDAFSVLVKLMHDYRLRDLFKPHMTELSLCIYKMDFLIQKHLPALQLHFQTHNLLTSMYASSWFLTLFSASLPLALARRIMDIFVLEGMDVLFRVAISILQTCEKDLLALDMEGLLKYLQRDLHGKFESGANQELLLSNAYLVPCNFKKLKSLEKDYNASISKKNEEEIELMRLRTENKLLRKRMEKLEEESSSLAGRLVQDQVTRANEAEEVYHLRKKLSVTLTVLKETQTKLNVAEETITNTECQEELMSLKMKEAEYAVHVRELDDRNMQLELANEQLLRAPSHDVQSLQEELIAVKLREAEASLSFREAQQRVKDLESSWKAHMERSSSMETPNENSSKTVVRILMEEVMSLKVREARAVINLRECEQKVMELETQKQISQNRLRRIDEENERLVERMDDSIRREQLLATDLKDIGRRLSDAESRLQEEAVLARIKDAERDHMVAELQHRIAEMYIQKEEMLTADQLDKSGSEQLAGNFADLCDEVMCSQHTRPHPFVIRSADVASSDESDGNLEDDIRQSEDLNRTLSDIVEGRSPLVTPRRPLPRFDYLGRSVGGGDVDGDNGGEEMLSNCVDSFPAWLFGDGGNGLLYSSVNVSNAGTELSRAAICGAELSRAAICGAELSRAAICGAELSRAAICGAELSRAAICGTELSRAAICGAELSRAAICGAELSRAAICGAELSRAAICGAELSRAAICGAELSRAAICGAERSGAEFSVAEIKRVELLGDEFSATELSNIGLPKTEHSGIDDLPIGRAFSSQGIVTRDLDTSPVEGRRGGFGTSQNDLPDNVVIPGLSWTTTAQPESECEDNGVPGDDDENSNHHIACQSNCSQKAVW